MLRFKILIIVLVGFMLDIRAGSNIIDSSQDTMVNLDSTIVNQNLAKGLSDTLSVSKKEGLVSKIINYFGDANKEKPHKKFDINFIGGPHYASDTKLGLGLVGAGIYRLNGCDKSMQPSNVSLFGDISTVGFYLLGIRGNTLFPKDKYRLNYAMFFYSFPTYYWGIGFNESDNDENKTKMNRFQSKVKVEFLASIMKNFYIGPILTWDYIKGSKIDGNISLFDGMDLVTRNYGAGLTIEYDSRDLITNAYKGYYFKLNQMFYPKFLWNRYAFSSTEIQASMYKGVWKGGILAVQLAATFNYGNPSWAMMAKLGDSNSMRGYYEGRYRDKNMIMGQIELRQHVWRRNGIAVWAGTGSVFHNASTFKHFLPNFGIGYRWEFKKRMNVRLDYGFGKSGQNGFIFNINEAF